MSRPSRGRNVLVAFYVSKAEKEKMQEIAARNGMNFSEYARQVILGKIKNEYQEQ